MRINGNDYNFGRVVYLTICRNGYNPARQFYGDPDSKEGVTIAFDPLTNPQLNTRIDFWIKKSGFGLDGSTAITKAKIDIYNIGPALQQFMNAYNAYSETESRWAEQAIKKYACCLKVGYKDGPLTTIFSGYIGSYNVERVQNDSTIDNIWHLYAQYPTPGVPMVGVSNKAVSGEDYKELAKQWITQTFVSGEEYLKAAVMAFPRETSALVAAPNLPEEETFSITNQSIIPNQTKLVALPDVREINNANFDTFFQIKYQHFRTGKEYQDVKEMWQKQNPMTAWNMSYEYLPTALEEIANAKKCHAYLDKNDETGMQTIYIYPAGEKPYANQNADFVIEDFRNLRRPPAVSGSMFQLDMMMEPTAKPGDSFELTITEGFRKTYNNTYSFSVNIPESTALAATAFAGANFMGISNVITEKEKKAAIKGTGNVFWTKYIAVFVVHQGSTHSAEWSTQVDCTNIILPEGDIYKGNSQ